VSVAMSSTIKIGDIFVVYEEEQPKQEFWYEIGKELANYYKKYQAWKKSKTQSKKIAVHFQRRQTDYSLYEIPTVYRKWR
jgi:uncharacterized protein YktA (UPF0223 family)